MMAGRRPLDDLPEELSYLKGPALDLVTQDDDLVASGMGDWSAFESALRRAMAGLSGADTEERCRQHRRLLSDWLEQQGATSDPAILALHHLLGALSAAHEILDPYDDDADRAAPAPEPRTPSVEVPEGFRSERRDRAVVLTDGRTQLVVREIDEKSYANLRHAFSTPRRKTRTADGRTVFPPQAVALNRAVGTTNVVLAEAEPAMKEVTYLLQIDDAYVLARLTTDDLLLDESIFQAALDSITFGPR